jgi:hypothetical protein
VHRRGALPRQVIVRADGESDVSSFGTRILPRGSGCAITSPPRSTSRCCTANPEARFFVVVEDRIPPSHDAIRVDLS